MLSCRMCYAGPKYKSFNQSIYQSQGSFIIFCKQDVIGMTVNANKKKRIQKGKNRRRLRRAKSFYLKNTINGKERKSCMYKKVIIHEELKLNDTYCKYS